MKCSENTTHLPKTVFTAFILLLSLTFLAACGGGGGGQDTGRFLDSAVEGLNYVSGEKSGTTDAEGTFLIGGDTVGFSIGDIVLGETAVKSMITPVDLVAGATDEKNPTVTNITRFLMTLDDDGKPINGIQIREEVRGKASGRTVNFTQSVVSFQNDDSVKSAVAELTVVTSAGTRTLISARGAQNHLRQTLATINSLIIGTWAVTNIEGIPDSVGGPNGVDASNSTWIFRPDGTHEWFFHFDKGGFFFDEKAQGRFTLNGSSLFVERMSTAITFSDNITLTFSNDNNTFSFLDDEGDRWTYSRVQ